MDKFKSVEEVREDFKNAIKSYLHSEKSKQGTSPEPLVSDTRELGTGCDSFASGATKDEGLDAAPLGHKIDTERECPTCWGDGEIDINDDMISIECPHCEGKGTIPKGS